MMYNLWHASVPLLPVDIQALSFLSEPSNKTCPLSFFTPASLVAFGSASGVSLSVLVCVFNTFALGSASVKNLCCLF